MPRDIDPRYEHLVKLGLPSNGRGLLKDLPTDEILSVKQDRDSQPTVAAMIATRNYMSFARVLGDTFAKLQPEIPIHLLLVDGAESDRSLMANVTVHLLPDLNLSYAYWYAAKFDATQFANAVKPVYVKYLGAFAEKVVYFDTDIALFARVDALLLALDSNDLVALPHTYEPFDKPERHWVHPSTADIFNSGLINAGCFAIKPANCTLFLDQWEHNNLGPGAFSAIAGGQTDQQYFNWAPLIIEKFHILKDRAYNVAYWNLHERGLRSSALDGCDPGWTVDDRPLVFFHFSGYDPRNPLALSRHDGRYFVYNMPAVAAILTWYTEQLFRADYSGISTTPYLFDEMANGVRLNTFLRDLLQKYEAHLPFYNSQSFIEADCLCAFLMTPLPATGSLLPLIAAEIYETRPDLQSGFPDAHTSYLHAHRYWVWFLENAGSEYDINELVGRFRRTLVSDKLLTFSEEVGRALSSLGAELQFLGAERSTAAEVLRTFGQKDLALKLMQGQAELAFSTSLGAILALYETRSDLQSAYPHIFGASHDAFLTWLTDSGIADCNVPEDAIEAFRGRIWNKSLARIFSFCARREEIGELARRHMLTEAPWMLIRELIRGAGDGLEYDLSDVEILTFLHRRERHVLVPLFLELPALRRLPFSSRLRSNKPTLLPAESQSTQWSAYGCKLHESYFDDFSNYLEDEVKKRVVPNLSVKSTVGEFLRVHDVTRESSHVVGPAFQAARSRFAKAFPSAEAVMTPVADNKRHLNIFGFFHADTGVGESSRGLALAAQQIAEVSRVPLCTGSVTKDILLHQLFHKYDYSASCNVIVSYPHQSEDFFGILPRDYMSGRANVIHLAWEQRDWNPYWKDVYDRYDEIWTISEFAAGPFRHLFGDKVRVIPNVVSVGNVKLKKPGRAHSRFRYSFIFDANSSMERKNPEGVVRAFVQAFAGTPQAGDVELYLKVGNLDRIEHAGRVKRLRDEARRSGLSIVFDGRVLTRPDLLSLVAHSDCYISLHRSEGFGYTMAEAMWFGVPVIASGYSGNLEYMDGENSFLVPCKETLVKEADGPFQRGSIWGEPNIDQAADLIRHVFSSHDHAKAIGNVGKASVRAKLNPASVAQRLAASPLVTSL